MSELEIRIRYIGLRWCWDFCVLRIYVFDLVFFWDKCWFIRGILGEMTGGIWCLLMFIFG